ncbi:hypothetical protein [Pseudomonas phage vB_PaeM_PS119XW]|uniref:Virion structural protein n=1 Tax=Pseudomonas phage vB_PaeM_PS119XW TaxID=2601632 RepID=A0A5C1K873_9CAUD|nr:hypothetical protein PP933_gp371 [Pseudomonas phage vB_PaeM_PS119XW]QEM42100.1 hypothetical protein [Pseudomonas phage vB_PaeM_PS119XW]
MKITFYGTGVACKEYRVYASAEITDLNTLTPIATIPATPPYRNYHEVDFNAIKNVQYYVVIRQVLEEGLFLDTGHTTCIERNTGALSNNADMGVDRLQRGDSTLGYFGTVPMEDLPGLTELVAAYSSLRSADLKGTTKPPYGKFMVNNEVYFIPSSVHNWLYPNEIYAAGFAAIEGTLDGTYITPQIKSDSRFKCLVEQGRDIIYQGHTYRPFIMDQWMFDNLFTPMNNNKQLRTASNLQVKYDTISKKDAYTAVALSNNKASKYVRQNTVGATILWYDHWLLSNIDICWKLME